MKSIQNQYRDLQEGKMTQSNFMRNVRMALPQYVTNVTSFNDTVKILKNKGILTEAKGKMPKGNTAKELYDEFEEGTQFNFNEVVQGIGIEHRSFPDMPYEKITKLVYKNLQKDPHYYTNFKLSGVKGYEPKYMDNVNPDDYKMKFLEKDNLIDKPNVMKPVKGFADAKADANKAKEETNDIVKGVEEFGLVAKSSRGVKKMEATGEKMKVVKKKLKEQVEEAMYFKDLPADPEKYKTVRDSKGKIIKATNAEGNEFQRGDVTTAFDGEKIKIAEFKEEQGKIKAIYNTGMFFKTIDIDGLNPVKETMRPGVDMGVSFEKFKRSLREMIRTALKESGRDGGDNMIDDEETSMY